MASLDKCIAVNVLKFESKMIGLTVSLKKQFLQKNSFDTKNDDVKKIPCHHGTVRRQDADV
jgi:hypothetical protein